MDFPERKDEPDAERELDELVARCLSASEHEDEFAVEALIAAHPRQAEAVRRRLRILHQAGFAADRGALGQLPERLGDFRLLQRIGGGGMGVVYLAEQVALERRVALKLIRPEHLYFPGARARFAREAQAVARLSHPGIVQVHTIGEAAGVPYLAMELVDGMALSDVLTELRGRNAAGLRGSDLLDVLCARSRLEPSPAVRASAPFDGSWADTCAWIGREIAQALEHAHQRGVVHRDLKPSNVMLTADARVLLVDFGLATASGVDPLTRTGSALGSLPYMAPEQVSGRARDIGPRTDVYGLGVTLYELASLRRPFDDPDETRLRASILEGHAPRLTAHAPHAPHDLEVVLAVAMAPEPRQRFASAADLARDLSHVLAREPIEARPAGVLERVRRWAERNPMRALAGALGAVILIGGPTGFGVFQSRAAAKERELGRELAGANTLAARRNEELAEANEQLERRSADLARALESESRERQRAEQNFAHALDAVDTMLTRVGADKLMDVPQMEGVRRELLEDALRFYERFVVEGDGDPHVELGSASTRRRVALIREELGDLAAAREAADAAVREMRQLEAAGSALAELPVELCMALAQQASTLLALQELELAEATQRELLARLDRVAEDPSHARFARRQSAITHQHLAFLLRDTGRVQEAVEQARRGVELLRVDAEALPPRAEALHELGVATLSLAVMRLTRVDAAESEGELLDATELLRAASELAPQDPRLRESLASALGNLGLLLSRQQLDRGYRPAGVDAEQALHESVELYSELIGRFPRRALFRAGLATAASNSCVHLGRLGRLNEARRHAEMALDAAEALVGLAPQSADHRSQLGAALCNVAKLDLLDGRAEAALAGLERAREELELAIRLEPRNAAFLGQRRPLGVARVEALLQLARWKQALEQLAEFEAQQTDAPARIWVVERQAECLSLVERDASLEAEERAQRVQELADGAVERLRALVDGGQEASKLARMPTFAPLREHRGFIDLFGDAGAER